MVYTQGLTALFVLLLVDSADLKTWRNVKIWSLDVKISKLTIKIISKIKTFYFLQVKTFFWGEKCCYLFWTKYPSFKFK